MSYGVKRPEANWTWVLEEEEALKHLKVSAFFPDTVVILTTSMPTMREST